MERREGEREGRERGNETTEQVLQYGIYLKAHPMNMPDSVSQYHHSRSNGLHYNNTITMRQQYMYTNRLFI